MTFGKVWASVQLRPIIGQLIRNGNRTGSVACWKTRKSVSYQTATERGDEMLDIRIKSKLIKRWSEWHIMRCYDGR